MTLTLDLTRVNPNPRPDLNPNSNSNPNSNLNPDLTLTITLTNRPSPQDAAEGAEAVSVPPVPLGDLAVQGRPQSAKQPGRVRGNSPRRVKAAPPHHDGWGVAL